MLAGRHRPGRRGPAAALQRLALAVPMSGCLHAAQPLPSYLPRRRAVPEPEAIGTLCGTVKIQSAGLLKMKQAQGKAKKKG